MKVHHLNCATLCPIGRPLVNGSGSILDAGTMICHVLLVETPSSGLVLVDTGFGAKDIERASHLGGAFLRLVRPRLDPRETARAQVEALGFSPSDVRHLVVTHLDLDHAGGLPDFPEATVHVHAAERSAALARASLPERERYKPLHWAHGPKWSAYDELGEPWFGFDCVRALAGLPPEIVLVPLFGHTRGHAGVAVQTADGWLLHAGDAYFFRDEVHASAPRCPAGLRVFQRLVAMDDGMRRGNQARLRALARDHAGEVSIFSAHDPIELERYSIG